MMIKDIMMTPRPNPDTRMKLLSLRLENFRSHRDTRLSFDEDMKVIVGENNVGKSSLISALQLLRRFGERPSPTVDDWAHSDLNSSMTVSAEFIPDKNELQDLASGVGQSVEALKRPQTDRLSLSVTWLTPDSSPILLARLGNQTIKTPVGDSKRLDTNVFGLSSGAYQFKQIQTKITDLLGRLMLFPEYRVRPVRGSSSSDSSIEGSNLASVLMGLNIGTSEQRGRWRQIRRTFSELFPGLVLEVMRQIVPGPDGKDSFETDVIRVGKGNASETGMLPESSQERIGSGIMDMILLLAYIVGSKDHIIVIDEPELHLHPHTQRLLRRVLADSSSQNEIIVITHSSLFVDLREPSQVIVTREGGGVSSVNQIPASTFNAEEKQRLSTYSADDKDFFFSRAVLMVEGDTEIGSMPAFAQKLDRNFDVNGVSMIDYGGSFFGLPLKLVRAFNFPFIVMCDKDALGELQEKIQIGAKEVKTSRVIHELGKVGLLTEKLLREVAKCENRVEPSVTIKDAYAYDKEAFESLRSEIEQFGILVLSNDFEGVLKQGGLGEVLLEGQKIFGKSKVLQGKYVAEHARTVPKELQKVIEKVVRQPHMTGPG